MTPTIQQYTIPEVCELLRVSRSTVDREIRRRRLKPVRIGRAVRIRESELARYLDQRER